MRQQISKQRRLPAQGHMLVQPGDKVRYDTIVGELDYVPGPLVRLDVAGQLGVAPERLGEKMVKKLNEKVEQGDVLAANSEFFTRAEFHSPLEGYVALWSRFLGYVYIREPLPTGPKEDLVFKAEEMGLSKLQFASDVRVKDNQVLNRGNIIFGGKAKITASAMCKVKKISLSEGIVILSPLFQATELPALLDGVIDSLPEPGSCRISSYGYRFAGAIGYGGERSGTLRPLLAETRDLGANDLPDDLEGCIVAARGGVTLEALRKLAEVQAAGLVLGCINIEILAEFSQQEPLRSLGLLMDLPFPIVILQGFGAPMLGETYAEIAALRGMRGAIDGSTQLRAGVARPELLVALPEEKWPDDVSAGGAEIHANLEVGSRVVLIREPYFGQQGQVETIDTGLKRTAAGTQAALATVRLVDGHVLQVPLGNCMRLAAQAPQESAEKGR